jgi:hypothetical protein
MKDKELFNAKEIPFEKHLIGMLELIQKNLMQISILLALQSNDPEIKTIGEGKICSGLFIESCSKAHIFIHGQINAQKVTPAQLSITSALKNENIDWIERKGLNFK